MFSQVVFDSNSDPENLIFELKSKFGNQDSEVSSEQLAVWKFLTPRMINIVNGYKTIAEFPILGDERADYIVVDDERAIIIEAKGWEKIRPLKDNIVEADGSLHVDPMYQLNNYISKFRYFHSSASFVQYSGILYLYRNNDYQPSMECDGCEIVHNEDELRAAIKRMDRGSNERTLDSIINGKFTITKDLISLINENKEEIIKRSTKALLIEGYGLTAEQSKILHEIMDAVRKKENRTFLIKGGSGSGKTLLAISLLLEAISEGYKALLAYRNNRFLNALRSVLTVDLGNNHSGSLNSLIVYYSTGRGKGIGEKDFDINKYGDLDIVIYDEAQRMSLEVIETTQMRSPVKVYFYDDSQILINDEVGNDENFTKYGHNITRRYLSSVFRTSKDYVSLVRHILWGETLPGKVDYEIRIFDNAEKMLSDLEQKKENYKIALLCAFTESKGNEKNVKDINNLRIGYPLPSGFEIYKNLNKKIYWLMNEKTEYPLYWQNKVIDPLSRCASVYGAQGFETHYAGLVWGRDLVWDKNKNNWVVNPDPITDEIGGKNSLKSLAVRNPGKALELLKNRYYILLTRGIFGIDIFFEDENTKNHIDEILKSKVFRYIEKS